MGKHPNKKFAHLSAEEAEKRRLRTNEYERRRQHKITDKLKKIRQALESNDSSRDDVLANAHTYILFLERRSSRLQFRYSPELEEEIVQNDFETHYNNRIAQHKSQVAMMQEGQFKEPYTESVGPTPMQQDSVSCQASGLSNIRQTIPSALQPIGNDQCKPPKAESVGLMPIKCNSFPAPLQSDFSLLNTGSAVPSVPQPAENGHVAGNTIPHLSTEPITASAMMDHTTVPCLQPAIAPVRGDNNIPSGACNQPLTAPAILHGNIVGGHRLQNFTDSAMADSNIMSRQYIRPHTSPAILDTNRNTGPGQYFQPATDSVVVDSNNVIDPYTQLLTAPLERHTVPGPHTQPFTTPATVGGTCPDQPAKTFSYPLSDIPSCFTGPTLADLRCFTNSHPLAGRNKKKEQRKRDVSHTKSRVGSPKTTSHLSQVSQTRRAATPCPPHNTLYHNYTTANRSKNCPESRDFRSSTFSSSESGAWPKQLSSTSIGTAYLSTLDLLPNSSVMEKNNDSSKENQAKTSTPALEHQPVNSMAAKAHTYQVYPLNEVSTRTESLPLHDHPGDVRSGDNFPIPRISNLSGRNWNSNESDLSHISDLLNQESASSPKQSQLAPSSHPTLSQTTQGQIDLVSAQDTTVSLTEKAAAIKNIISWLLAPSLPQNINN